MIKNNLTWKIKTNSQWFYTSRKKHKNQILSRVACCIRLKCSAPGKLKDYQEAKHDSLTVSVTWHYNLITRMYVSQDVQHCNRKTKIGANGEYMEMAGCGGNSRSTQQGRGSQNEIAGHRDPSTSICGFTRHPDLEVNNGGDLMICRNGTGWRHWSLLSPKEYKNAHWKPTHHERNSGDPRKSWVLLVLHAIEKYPGCNISTQAWFLAVGLMLVTTNLLLLLSARLRAWISRNAFSFSLYFKKKQHSLP